MSASAAILTLGGQPQVVTLALDRLLVRDPKLREVLIVSLNPDVTARYATALSIINKELQGPYYADAHLQVRVELLRASGSPLDEITSSDSADAVYAQFHQAFSALKQRDFTIHLCPTGGRRLIGMLAVAAAQHVFGRSDRIWHLSSSDSVRADTDRGAQLHLPDDASVRLIPIPFTTVGQLIQTARDPDAGRLPPADRERLTRCQLVWKRLSSRPRVREALLAQLRTDAANILQDVANQLSVQPTTLSEYNSTIFALCREIWDLQPSERLNLRWLREQFASFDPDGV